MARRNALSIDLTDIPDATDQAGIDLSDIPDAIQDHKGVDLADIPDATPIKAEEPQGLFSRAAGPAAGIVKSIPKIPTQIPPESVSSVKNLLNTVTPPLSIDTPESRRIAGDVGATLAQTESDMLGFVPLVIGTDNKVANSSKKMSQWWKDVAKEMTPEDQNIVDEVVKGVASTAPYYVAGVGIASGVKAASVLGPIAVKLAPYVGSAASGMLEAAQNAGQQFMDLRGQGMDEKEAVKRADTLFWGNVVWNAIMNKAGGLFDENKRGILRQMFTSSGPEGLQELGQEVLAQFTSHDFGKKKFDFWKSVTSNEALMSGGIGAVVGGLFGGVRGATMPKEVLPAGTPPPGAPPAGPPSHFTNGIYVPPPPPGTPLPPARPIDVVKPPELIPERPLADLVKAEQGLEVTQSANRAGILEVDKTAPPQVDLSDIPDAVQQKSEQEVKPPVEKPPEVAPPPTSAEQAPTAKDVTINYGDKLSTVEGLEEGLELAKSGELSDIELGLIKKRLPLSYEGHLKKLEEMEIYKSNGNKDAQGMIDRLVPIIEAQENLIKQVGAVMPEDSAYTFGQRFAPAAVVVPKKKLSMQEQIDKAEEGEWTDIGNGMKKREGVMDNGERFQEVKMSNGASIRRWLDAKDINGDPAIDMEGDLSQIKQIVNMENFTLNKEGVKKVFSEVFGSTNESPKQIERAPAEQAPTEVVKSPKPIETKPKEPDLHKKVFYISVKDDKGKQYFLGSDSKLTSLRTHASPVTENDIEKAHRIVKEIETNNPGMTAWVRDKDGKRLEPSAPVQSEPQAPPAVTWKKAQIIPTREGGYQAVPIEEESPAAPEPSTEQKKSEYDPVTDYRIKRIAKAKAKIEGSPESDALELTKKAYGKMKESVTNPEQIDKVLSNTEKTLNLKPLTDKQIDDLDKTSKGGRLKGEESNDITETPGDSGAAPMGDRGGEPLEGEPAKDVRGAEGVGPSKTGTPKRPESDRGSLPQGKDEAGGAGAPAGRSVPDRAGTSAGDVGVSPSGGRQAGPAREPRVKSKNYRITESDQIGSGTPAEKYKNNIEVIKLLKQIESEGRQATPAEQAVLVKYVGWGDSALSRYFDERNYDDRRFVELKELLTEDEYKAASASTPNAHYTSPEVIQSIYQIIDRLGFTSGRIIEPGSGVGHFAGLMPEGMMSESRMTMVELDSVSGRIIKQLYPEEDTRIQGYETVKMPDNFFDVGVGNVPFGNFPVHDPAYQKLGLTRSIHNYFFAKTIDKIRPGGVMAFITSRYTMDSADTTLRKYLNDRADLVGAIRLPNTAFKKNAGTEVVTDIIILKKRETWEQPKDSSWVKTAQKTKDGSQYDLNTYFVKNRDMMLGSVSMKGTMYSAGEFTLNPTGDLATQLGAAIGKLESGVYKEAAQSDRQTITAPSVTPPSEVKDGGYFIQNGEVFKKDGDSGEPVRGISIHHAQSFLNLRDQLRKAMNSQLMGIEADVPVDQKKLGSIYDAFVRSYGELNSRKNEIFAADPDYSVMMGLEKKNKNTGKWEKSDIFTKRVLVPEARVDSVESAQEAMYVSLNESGKINLARMEELTGKSQSNLIADLKGDIYKNPETQRYETASEYLSGNVKKKLEIAESVARNDPSYKENVTALKEVQPKDLKLGKIGYLKPGEFSVRLGSPFIPAKYIDEFISHLLGNPQRLPTKTIHIPQASTWTVETIDYYVGNNVGNINTWGSDRYSAINLISDTLNHKLPSVYDGRGDDRVLNKEKTDEARDKQEKIKEEFQRWVQIDSERVTDLEKIYNKDFNNTVRRTYDGSHLKLPGVNQIIFNMLRPHQKNGIFRALQGRNVLLAHAVGAGKTWEMAAIAMESKRIGLFNKTIITVPKNRLKPTAAEFLQMYPAANLLVADTTDLAEQNRKAFKARIATGNWDAVIISHNSFEKIRMSDESIQKFMDDQIAEFESAKNLASKSEGTRGTTVKELEKARKRFEVKIKKLMRTEKKDEGLTFEELGVDQIVVDEAQSYKSLFLITQMQRIKGVPTSEAGRAFDMFMKTEHLNKINGNKGVVFATGTPITNTMAEFYIMQRYLQNSLLKDYGIQNFDSWADTFGDSVTAWEIPVTGRGMNPVTRFARFTNVPELLDLFYQTADIQTAKMLNLPVPKLKGGSPTALVVPENKELNDYIEKLMARALKVKNRQVDSTVDNMLKISSDGRKAALDMRLVNPGARDNPDSKVNRLVDLVKAEWSRTSKVKGTQLIFSNLGTPKSGEKFSVYGDVKKKLISKGIPANQIAFVHDAKTDDARLILEDKINSGEIRILIGSTEKMGMGMNVQTRLSKLYHLDVPWRPDWIEQRNGRILRQGNQFFDEVEIVNMATAGSFDAFMWQTVERKARMIQAVMSGEMSAREFDDLADDVMLESYAQMKAIISGDPLIMEKIKLDAELNKLASLESTYIKNQREAHAEIARIPEQIKAYEHSIGEFKSDLETILKNTSKEFSMKIGDTEFDTKEKAGEKIIEISKNSHTADKMGSEFHIGEYKGLPLFIHISSVIGNSDTLLLHGVGGKYSGTVSESPEGTIRSLDHQASKESIQKTIERYEFQKESIEKKIVDLKEEVKKPFADAEKLKNMIERKAEIEKKLDMSKGESTTGAVEGGEEGDNEVEGQSRGGGGGDAFYAPSSKPGGPAGENEKNVVYPGAPNDFQPHIEMPELVRLVKDLTGDIPAIGGLIRNLGLFRDEGAGQIKLNKDIFRDPVQATKILAHEFGHLTDWLPERTLSRGNLLGRLKSLRAFLSETINELPNSDEPMPSNVRMKVRSDTIKQIVAEKGKAMKDYTADQSLRKEVATELEKRLPAALSKELATGKYISKKTISDELKKATLYWSPFDPDNASPNYLKYRFSSRELYAEAVSMLMNKPDKLKELAPNFYRIFWANLERKPEVYQKLMELDALLSQGESVVLQQRQNDIRQMFRKGEDLFKEIREERKLKRKSMWFQIKDELIDKNTALIEKTKAARASGTLNPEDDPVYFLETHNYIGGKIHNMATDFDNNIILPAEKAGLTAEDVGEYLFLRRILTERNDIANPLGQNRLTASRQMDFLMSKFSPEQKTVIESLVKKYDETVQKLNMDAYRAGLYSQEIANKITTNPGYATFQVLDYLNDYVSAGIIKQIGTFKEIANPLTSTFMKMISVRRAIERELARKKVATFMQRHNPSEIIEADYKWVGDHREVRDKEGFGTIIVHENGKIKGYYVDPYIADSVSFQPSIHSSAVVEILKYFNRSWFRPIYITFNMGFQSFNAIRDFQRSWKLNPNTTLVGQIKNYFKAVPASASRIWGNNPDALIREMYENGMLSVTFNDMTAGATEEDSQIEYILRKHDADSRTWKKYLNPFKLAMGVVEDVGNFIETLPKVAGYISRKKTDLPMQQVAHEVRVYSGSPDFWRKGKGYWWYNEFFLFSNAIKEGFRGDIEGAFKNPRTRGGYWWKSTGTTFLPKLLMYMAAIGFFGKKLKDHFDRQTEYDKTNYTTIPLGNTDDGQAVYLRVPQDEQGRFLGGIFWKLVNGKGDVLDGLRDIFSFTAGQVPSQAPIIDMISVLSQYAVGQNPYDYFRGRNILTEDEQKVRGVYGLKKIGKWFMNKAGIPFVSHWGYQDKPGEPWIVKSVRMAPIVSRFIKVTDYGLKEKKRALRTERDVSMAERRLKRKERRRELAR